MTEENLQTLEENVQRRAAERIKSMFIESAQLEDIPKIRKKYEADLKAIESQLESVQAGKLSNVGQAKKNVDSSTQYIEKLHGDFGELGVAIRDSQSLLKHYPNIRAASAARQNLNTTLEHVFNFADVPVRIEKIRKMLVDDHLLLREVWKETHCLILWKQSMKAQLCEWRSAASSKQGSDGVSQYSGEHMIGEYLEDKLSMIEAFVDDLEGHLLSRVKSCFDIAFKDSAKLVQAIEVIEAIEHFQRFQRRAVELWAVTRGQDASSAIAALKHTNIRRKAIAALDKEIKTRAMENFGTSFFSATTKAADSGLSMVKATLDAAGEMRDDLKVLFEDVAPCFPSSYHMLPKWRAADEEFIVPQVMQLYNDRHIDEMDAGDILTLIDWLKLYDIHMIDMGIDEPCCEFGYGTSRLLAKYIERMKAQMDKWFKNIALTPTPRNADNSGRFFTSMPEMLFQVVYMQAGVVKDRLEGGHLRDVLLSISATVTAEQQRQLKLLHEKTCEALCGRNAEEAADVESLVAEVNDCARIADKCDEFLMTVVDGLLKRDRIAESGHSAVRDSFDGLLSNYTSHAVSAALFIPTFILSTDLSDYFAQLFTPDWENGRANIVDVVLQTCTDYLGDIKVWIIDHFFAKVIREFFDQIIARYVERMLLYAQIESKSFVDNLSASLSIRRDANEITAFFRSYTSELEKTGIRAPHSSVQMRIEVLYLLADIFSMPSEDDFIVADATMGLLDFFEDRGAEIATLVFRLHPRGPRNEKSEKEIKDRLLASQTAWKTSSRGAAKSYTQRGKCRFVLDFIDRPK